MNINNLKYTMYVYVLIGSECVDMIMISTSSHIHKTD